MVPIVLQKSQKARRLIFRQRTKQATSADQCSLKPVGGIACEFGVRRRSPPHNCSIVAPTARRILGRYPKNTFATLAHRERTSRIAVGMSVSCQERSLV